jgi:serine/threonine protein phosphatase PrpC
MEDRYLFVTLSDNIHIYTVLDGHGGESVVDFILKNLEKVFKENYDEYAMDLNSFFQISFQKINEMI